MKFSFPVIFSLLLLMTACNGYYGPASNTAPFEAQNEFFGSYQSACKPTNDDHGFALSKQNEIFLWGNLLKIKEKLFTSDGQCGEQSDSEAHFETTVKFKGLDSSALPHGFHELSILDYRVTLWAGALSGAFTQARYCGRNDWMTVYAANADVTECQEKEMGDTSREKMRWFVQSYSTQTLRLGFLKGSQLDLEKIEWLEPGDFRKRE